MNNLLSAADSSNSDDIGYYNTSFDVIGITYQVEVTMLCINRALNKYDNLLISTEEDQKKVGKFKVGKFDDITIRYNDGGKDKAINIQIKHIDEENDITI